jgi:hypothetical protein
MRLTTAVMLLAGLVMASNSAVAQQMNADDLKWVNQCIIPTL